jgi:hypothetical protein
VAGGKRSAGIIGFIDGKKRAFYEKISREVRKHCIIQKKVRGSSLMAVKSKKEGNVYGKETGIEPLFTQL